MEAQRINQVVEAVRVEVAKFNLAPDDVLIVRLPYMNLSPDDRARVMDSVEKTMGHLEAVKLRRVAILDQQISLAIIHDMSAEQFERLGMTGAMGPKIE